MINSSAKIFVAGHRGLVGNAIVRELQRQGFNNLVVRTHAELDLTSQAEVGNFFASEKPEYVFLAAARVGGIVANNSYPAEFIYSNLSIQNNVFHSAWENNVERMIFLGSSCIYPKECPQPIKEEYLLSGPLEPTNRPYAIAKIAGVEMCHAYNRQYGTKYLAVMPTNLYGPGDSYDLSNSHVMPALIRKMHEAKIACAPEVVLWGSGMPKREFLYVDDLANALVWLATLDPESYDKLVSTAAWPMINVGTGEDGTIRELAEVIAGIVGYTGRFVQDTSKPDGTMRKVLDVSKMQGLGWKPKTSLEEGIRIAYADFQKRFESRIGQENELLLA